MVEPMFAPLRNYVNLSNRVKRLLTRLRVSSSVFGWYLAAPQTQEVLSLPNMRSWHNGQTGWWGRELTSETKTICEEHYDRTMDDGPRL